MALIKISDTVMVNSDRIDSIEAKKDKTWIWSGGRSYTIDIPFNDFMKKYTTTREYDGSQHFSG